jgi:hypothetical protein
MINEYLAPLGTKAFECIELRRNHTLRSQFAVKCQGEAVRFVAHLLQKMQSI